MGVPVVALRGRTHAGRMTASVLTAADLAELVSDSPEDYCGVAAGLPGDLPRLAALRADLRGRLSASPLCDGAGFVRGLEAVYPQMWQRWCAGRRINASSSFWQ